MTFSKKYIFLTLAFLCFQVAVSDVRAEEEVADEELFDDEVDFEDTDSVSEETASEESDLSEEFSEEEKSIEQEATKEKIVKEAEPEPPVEEIEPVAEPPAVVESEPIPEPTPVAEPEPTPIVEESTPESLPEPEPLMVSASDDPDLVYEAKLHDIFLNFYNSKTSEQEWQTLVGQRQAERYEIKGGDNLWNISQTIFGDGHYWPKIWSLNSSITNPHIISPRNSIRFLLGDESGPPVFAVTEKTTDESTATTTAATADEDSSASGGEVEANEPEIPPPLRVSRPVVKKLPPSLPAWQDASLQDNYDEFGISYVRRKILDVEDKIFLPSFIAETLPEDFGRVSEIEVGNNIASAYQYVYVAMKSGVGQIGDTYLAVANRGENKSVDPSIKGFLGYSYDVLGEIQLVERVDGQDEKKSGEVFRALVLRIVNPVSVGATLIKGEIEKVQITEEGPRSQVVAQVIGGSYFNRRQVYGNESIAFLNRGQLDGLEAGQILPIRANLSIRNEKTIVRSNVRPIGWARVLKTTPHFATVVIVRAWSDILTGDVTGSGELLPQLVDDTGFSKDSVTQNTSLDSELDDDSGGADTTVPPDENSGEESVDGFEDEEFSE